MRIFAIIITSILCLTGCRTQIKYVPVVNERDSIYIDRMVPYLLPADSATIRALMECDEDGKAILSWLDITNTENVELKFKIDSLGQMVADMKVKPDTIYLPSKEIYVDRKVEVPVKVERKLSKWENLKMDAGGFAIASIVVLILIVFGKMIYKIRKGGRK